MAGCGAACAAVGFSPAAKAIDVIAAAGSWQQSAAINQEGDGALYKPKARIEAAGSKSTRIGVKMPDPGPLSNKGQLLAPNHDGQNGMLH